MGARADVDFEFTRRFGKNKNTYRQRKRFKHTNNDTPNQQNGIPPDNNDNETKHTKKYSLMDPNNPNYTNDMKYEDEDTMYESLDEEEGFSTDAYYVPFRVNNAKTKRKPDAPFMAMFAMYADKNQQPSDADIDGLNEKEQEQEEEEEQVHGDQLNLQNGNEHIIEEEEEKTQDIDDADVGSSPPLNPQIPTTEQSDKMKLNPLDSLRERYNKRNIPPSLQPDALSNAFQSEKQKAMQNELNGDESLLNGIRESVQMITSNGND